MIELYDELLAIIGDFKSMSLGQELQILLPIDASNFKNQIYKLAIFSETWWPYYGDELRKYVDDFQKAISKASHFNQQSNNTEIYLNIFWDEADKLQNFIRKDIDRNFDQKNLKI